MPIYEYTCRDCNTQFEKFVRSMAADVEIKCPHCSGTHVKKGWSVFGTAGGEGSLGGREAGGAFSAAASSCNTGGTWGIRHWEPGALSSASLAEDEE